MASIRIEIPGVAPRTLPLAGQTLTLGRASDNSLTYPEDSVLSRRHLRIEADAGEWYVLDLGSKNGTVLNGRKLAERHKLVHGDILSAGSVTLTYETQASRQPDIARTIIFTPFPEEDTSSRTSVHMNLQQAVAAGKLQSALTAPTQAGTPRVQTLLDAGRELASHRPLEELFPKILSLALDAVGAERGVLLTKDGDNLNLRANHGEGFRISQSVRDRVLNGRESLLVVDVNQDEALMASRTIISSGVRSLMAVPLQTDSQVIGLLYLDSSSFLKAFSQEDLTLATVLANIAAIRIEHAHYAERAQAEKILQNELRQAAEIQISLFPAEAPAIPGYDIAGMSVPCRSCGGDYFDYVDLEGGKLGVLLGDVSGKGLSAALLLAGLQARVHVLAEQSSQADDLMAKLNRRIAPAWPGNRFMTMCILSLDPASGEFTYCNAGHNPPWLLRVNGEVEMLTEGGPVLGILKNAPYCAAGGTMNPGDILLLFTDGASEAEDAAGKEIGENGVLELLKEAKEGSSTEIIRVVYDAVQRHLAGQPAADDVTLLAIRRL